MSSLNKQEAFDYEDELNASEVEEVEEQEQDLEGEEEEEEYEEENIPELEHLKEVVFDRKKNKAVNEDVWDDSALITAWDAAVEEYELYHSSAAKASANHEKSSHQDKSAKVVTASKVQTKTTTPHQKAKASRPIKKVSAPKPQEVHATEAVEPSIENEAQPTSDYYENHYGYYGHQVDSNSNPHYQYPSTYPNTSTGFYSYPTSATQTGKSPIPPPMASHPQYNPYSTGPQHPPQPNMGHTTQGYGMLPPPPPPPAVSAFTEDEALANLLMAWYYSGYYTGLYQARRHGQ
ncbi:hypothetical protein K7432_014206 [Basidiobolus ranarum]|uniref:Survival Motor Neuron Gemin2-binding domain-containing protein n=1 Tax=Basidiobolus ranarum TaxID=34480 RepID=A0ABR2WHX3_9FUNG